MPRLIDGIYDFKNSVPDEKRYQHCHEIYLEMRKLVASLPELLLRGSHEPIRYPWVEWARLTLTISAANKVIGSRVQRASTADILIDHHDSSFISDSEFSLPALCLHQNDLYFGGDNNSARAFKSQRNGCCSYLDCASVHHRC